MGFFDSSWHSCLVHSVGTCLIVGMLWLDGDFLKLDTVFSQSTCLSPPQMLASGFTYTVQAEEAVYGVCADLLAAGPRRGNVLSWLTCLAAVANG